MSNSEINNSQTLLLFTDMNPDVYIKSSSK
jgi:hypothetical protein